MSGIIEMLRTLTVTYGLQVVGAILIFVIGRWLARLLANGLRSLLSKAKVDHTLVSFLGNIAYYALLAIVVIAALNNVGISTTSIVAVFGAATLAIGLALQDSLGNLAAGVVIILLRPYQAHDYVKINDAEGFVSEIHIFHTLLTTRDNKAVFVPNKDAISGNIVNYSKNGLIRMDWIYDIGYGDDLLKAKRLLMEIVQAEERIAKEPSPVVAVKELGESSVRLVARCYVLVQQEPAIGFAVHEQVKLRFDREGISIPFPQRDIHLYQN